MKKSSKLLYSFMTLVLSIVLVISACSSGGGSSSSSSGGSTTSSSSSSSSSSSNDATSNGEETDERVEIEIMTMLFQEVPSTDNEYYTILQDMTNTKLNIIWVPNDDYDTRFDLVIASGDLPEVISQGNFNRPTLLQAIKHGAFWDLTDFLGDMSEYPNLRDGMTPGSWRYVHYDGRIMGIPRSRSLMDNGIHIRQDWLDELGIPMPTTVDEFYDAVSRISKEKNVIGLLNDPLRSPSFWAGFGIVDPTYNEEGGMIKDFLTPQFSDLVRWYRKAYEDGLMATEYAALTDSDKMDLITSGRAATFDYSMYLKFRWTDDIKKHTPEGQLEIIPPLKAPAGYAAILDIGTRGAQYISRHVPEEKVSQILKYFDKTASEEVTNLAYYGKEGVHHEIVDGQPVLNELGQEQIQVTALNPLTPRFTLWGKVHSPTATAAENAEIEKVALLYGEHGKENPFRWIYSETWLDVWPDYDSQFQSMVTQAVVGSITMEEYEEYVEGIRNDPRIRQAFLEFAKDFEERGSIQFP